MNYILEINAFERRMQRHPLPITAQLLWYKLMNFDNTLFWSEWFSIDNDHLSEILCAGSDKTVRTARNQLVEDGLLIFERGAKGRPSRYKLVSVVELEKQFTDQSSLTDDNECEAKPDAENSTDRSLHDDERGKKDEPDSDSDKIVEIVNYLNKKAGTAYKSTVAKTRQTIQARLHEGFTIDDFKIVIAKKCAEWIGTDMQRWLRPETLFGEKFEGYLNARRDLRKEQFDPDTPLADWEKEWLEEYNAIRGKQKEE